MPARENYPKRAVVYLNTERNGGESVQKKPVEKLALLLLAINNTNIPFWLSDEDGLVLTIEEATEVFGQSIPKAEVLGNANRALGRKKLLFPIGQPPVYTPEEYLPTEIVNGREILQRPTRFKIIDKLNVLRENQGEVQFQEYILEVDFSQVDGDDQEIVA